MKINNIKKQKPMSKNFNPFLQMDKKEKIARLAKKIESVQFNIKRIQQGKEAYNRNQIRRTRKYKQQQPVKINKTVQNQLHWRKKYKKYLKINYIMSPIYKGTYYYTQKDLYYKIKI